jgi:hypothetical protein
VAGATVISRVIGGPSIYSARLGEKEEVAERQREADGPARPDLEGAVEQDARRSARAHGSKRSERAQRR